MHKRLQLVIGLFLIILAYSAYGVGSFDVSVEAVKNRIYPNETAEFKLVINNNVNIIETFEISSPDTLFWDVYTLPRKDYVVEVFPGKSRSVDIFFRPLYVEPGIYSVRINVYAQRQKQRVTEELDIEVRNPAPGYKKYVPGVATTLIVPETVDPRKEMDVKLRIRNLIPLPLKDLRLHLFSNSGLIDQSKTVSLEPNQETIIEFPIKLDPLTPPQKDYLKGEIIYIDEENKSYIFRIDRKPFEVADYSSFVLTPKVSKGVFGSTKTISVFNDGNVPGMYIVTEPVRFLDSVFAKTSPPSNIQVVNGKKMHSWSVVLEPQQKAEVVVSRNYFPLFFLFLVVVLGVLAYFLWRSPVVLYKTASKVRGNEEEGITHLKVTLFLKNRSSKPVDDITLVDRIPHIIEVEKEFHMGTIKPDKIIKRGGKPTKIVWKIPALEPYEERIVTYKITSKLSIVGGLTLPSAYVKFVKPNGKHSVYVSNSFILSAD